MCEVDELNDHSFVICAYKESPFLEECIRSLKEQTVSSEILMVTSTPNDYITEIAQRNEIPLYVNPGEGGITQDWNFGYSMCKTPYITIAHQDDVYRPDYAETVLGRMKSSKQPLICFTDYGELRNGEEVLVNSLLKVKRTMLLPLRGKLFSNSRWMRRRVLSMGCPICCPSVTFARENLPEQVFVKGFRSCEDWEAWEKLSKRKGAFLYCHKVLMLHRIHEGSETSAIIGDNARSDEEYQMFCKFWPEWIARRLVRVYSKGQESNAL